LKTVDYRPADAERIIDLFRSIPARVALPSGRTLSYQRNRLTDTDSHRGGRRNLPTGRYRLLRRLLAHC